MTRSINKYEKFALYTNLLLSKLLYCLAGTGDHCKSRKRGKGSEEILRDKESFKRYKPLDLVKLATLFSIRTN